MEKQNRVSKVDHVLTHVYKLDDYDRAREIESLIKAEVKERGIFDKTLVPDGYTETVSIEYLPTLIRNVNKVTRKKNSIGG